ncbi:MAG TPA: carbohydrate ABC transporter permease [Candidatus Cryosericum sp.]|nr:carbohydrate ABC transporter permease [Candidatus Cryosericum sp.]
MSESAVQKARPKKSKRFKNSIQSKKRSQQIADTISFLVIIFFAALVMLPIWWMIRSSLMKSLEIFKWPPQFFPKEWLFSNYNIKPTTFDFWRYLGNTLTIVVPCVVFGTITAVFCGYAFARLRFRGKAFLFSLCVGSMLLPTMVTLIPIYIAWSSMGLTDTYWPLILPYLCGGGAFNIFLVRQFIKTLPRELDESASIDGAGYFRTLASIIVPSIKPAIIVVALLIFITTWNDLLQQTIYISSREKYTMAVGLTTFMGSFKNDYAGMFAATCLSFLPGVIVYLVGQKYFVEGIVMTGMKN